MIQIGQLDKNAQQLGLAMLGHVMHCTCGMYATYGDPHRPFSLCCFEGVLDVQASEHKEEHNQ